MSVDWVPIGDVLHVADAEVAVDPAASYPMLGVLGHGRGLLMRDEIRGSETSYKTLRRMSAGQVVYSRLKAFEGAFAVVAEEASGRYASQEFPNFNLDTARVHVNWLGHMIHTRWFAARIKERSRGIGARRERLSIADFLSVEIPLPKLDIQHAVAARLDRVASLAEAGAEGADGLSAVKAKLLAGVLSVGQAQAFGNFLRRRAEAVPVEDLEQYPMLGVQNRGRGPFDAGTIQGSETKYKHLFRVQAGDLVYLKLGAWEGAFGIIPEALDGRHTSSEFISYELDSEQVDTNFLEALVTWDAFAVEVGGLSQGTNLRRRRLNPAVFEATTIQLPPLDVQRRIGRRLASLKCVGQLQDRRRSLARLMLPAARNEEFRKLLDG